MKVKISAPEKPESIVSQAACTLDVAGRGARISGIKYVGSPGDVVVVERGNVRSRFKVAWVGAAGTARDGQLGLRAIEPVRGLWGIETSPPDDFGGIEPDGIVQPLAAVAAATGGPGAPKAPAGTRSAGLLRYTCRGEVALRKDAQFALTHKAALRDIGTRGCFVMTKEKFPINARMVLELKIGQLELQVRASVKTAEPLGMWMEWVDLPQAEREQINELVERLAV